jgi:hypothetical protein
VHHDDKTAPAIATTSVLTERSASVLGLVLLWSRDEPGRVGQVALVPRPLGFGRRAEDTKSCESQKAMSAADRTATSPVQGNAMLQSRCAAGSLLDCGLLGENLVGGIGGPADRARGMELLARACKGGVQRACKAMGGGGSGR